MKYKVILRAVQGKAFYSVFLFDNLNDALNFANEHNDRLIDILNPKNESL